jgi:hypothetical protein
MGIAAWCAAADLHSDGHADFAVGKLAITAFPTYTDSPIRLC